MKKVFKNIEALNIVSFVNRMNKEMADELPLKFRWNLKKNIEVLLPIADVFEKFRNEQIESLQEKWFDEEHSDEFYQTVLDENGNAELDSEGNEISRPARKIKEEFMDEYRDAISELNKKLNEISDEENEVEIKTVDFDAFVDCLPDDTKIDFDTLTILSFMDTTTNIKK